MSQRSRTFLFSGPFSNGQRPDENDFNDVWDSFLNYQDDPIALNTDGNYVLDNALLLGNTAADDLGAIKFNGATFEFREATGWQTLGSSSGSLFEAVGAADDIAYNDGNVGINTGNAPTNYKFQVALGVNSGTAEQVRFGSAVIHTRTNNSTVAYFSHQSFANNSEFALSQEQTGFVTLNASNGRSIRFRVNNNAANQMTLASNGDLVVNGNASKTNGGGSWVVISDERAKKKIQPFKDGLNVLKKISPIRFQYNGKIGTSNGEENIGVSANEIKELTPYMVSNERKKLNSKDKEEVDVLVYDSSALIYIAVNAIKELSQKVKDLELQLKL